MTRAGVTRVASLSCNMTAMALELDGVHIQRPTPSTYKVAKRLLEEQLPETLTVG